FDGDVVTDAKIYLNAVSFFVDQARGHARAIIAPGEPFDDENGDHAHDPTETFINLRYPLSLGAGGRSDSFLEDPSAAQASMVVAPGGESYQVQTTTGRDERGLPIVAPVNFMGVFYNAGNIIGEGTATYFGALVAGGDVRQTSVHADSPTIYFDQRLELGLWPPPEIAIPRTYITLWQSSGF
ncbi:MAG: hypothetical protein ACE5HU_02495, partial [Acidobacteriota bacterium]